MSSTIDAFKTVTNIESHCFLALCFVLVSVIQRSFIFMLSSCSFHAELQQLNILSKVNNI